MQTFTELNENKNIALALGYFDGVHLGHKAVINAMLNYAKQNGLKTAVLTFKEHPCCYLKRTSPKYVCQNREDLIAQLGVDYLYKIDFDSSIAELSAEDYIQNIIYKYFQPNAIFTGFNHTFGKNHVGNPNLLNKLQNKYNYKYFEINPQKCCDFVISSSKIRECIKNGQIELANSMLGYKFSISAKVVEGKKLGRVLGYRTANQFYPENIVELPFGVYKVETDFGTGITNFGIRPTVDNSLKPVLETHILNFDEDIYGKELSIKFVKQIRKEIKFDSVEDLKRQIKKDISDIKEF